MIISSIKLLPNLLMNKFSSVFLAADDSIILNLFGKSGIVVRIYSFLAQFLYFVMKWIMYIVDVIYFYILELAGVHADTSLFDSASSDTTFRFLIDNKELVTTTVKNFIAVAIVLILVTTIIAIIKQQAKALQEKKIKKGSENAALKSMFKSFLLIILTPLFAIFAIVASSVLISALFNATNLSDAKSLSARVFSAAASTANKYKVYADSGTRMPIIYLEDDESKGLNYTTKMIGNESYPSFRYFDESEVFTSTTFTDPVNESEIDKKTYSSAEEAWKYDVYYNYYDRSTKYSRTGTNGDQYKILKTNAYEYYTMSEVICYALDTMEPLYFVTIQELLDSVKGDSYADVFKKLLQDYNIRLIRNSECPTVAEINYCDVGNSSDEQIIGFNGVDYYYDQMRSMFIRGAYSYIQYESTLDGNTYTYTHIKDAVDEIEGAKFVIAYKSEVKTAYVTSLNGEYYKVGENYLEAQKYYYKPAGSTRYKKVDLYYVYNSTKDVYEKSSTFDASTQYYYKLGSDCYAISESDKSCFYYKNQENEYVSIDFGQNFYTKSITYCYAPFASGIKVGNNTTFVSDYSTGNSIITARGLFDSNSRPTAIRKLSNGSISFYRDDLELISEGSVSDVASFQEVEEEEESSGSNVLENVVSGVKKVFSKIKKFITAMFNPLSLIPDLTLDESAVKTTYTYKTSEVLKLSDNKFHISYFFADAISSWASGSDDSVQLYNLFDPLGINYIVLIFGSVAFFKICTTAVFGLINRIFNVFLMIMIYPLACATIPLDDIDKKSKSGSYTKWSKKYTELIYSTYGLILGLNITFLIIPVIDELEFITAANLQDNAAAARVASVLANPLVLFGANPVTPNYNLFSKYLNKILRIVCDIVLFTVIAPVGKKGAGGETFYSAIQSLVSNGAKNGDVIADSPIHAVKKTMQSVTQAVTNLMFPEKMIKNAVEKAGDAVKQMPNFIPGSAVVDRIKRDGEIKNEYKEKKDAFKDLVNSMANGASAQEIQRKLDVLTKTKK